MKKIYTLLFITSVMGVMSAQTTVDFTLEEGYVQGPVGGSDLGETSNWGGNNWFIYPDAARERLETNASYSWARWGAPFIVSDTEISFEVHFKFNVDLPLGKLISRFGFNDNGSSSGNIANIQLSTLNDGSLSIRKNGNGEVDSGAAGLTDFQQDDLVCRITLTLGADAASSSLSSKIINVTDGISSGVAVVNGIPEAVFNAASSGGISGFIHAQDNIGNTRNFLVDKVVMTQGNTLNNVTWTGGTDTDWATAANWDINTVPSATDNVIIPDVATAPIIGATTEAEINNLTITEPDGINITTGGSLIVNGTSSGNVTYNRDLATTNCYLVSSPVVGETYDDAYVTANGIASGTQNTNSRGIAPYVTSDDTWDYMQAGETATFSAGTGYSVQRSSTGDVSFTGTLNVADAGVDVVLDATGNRFNLLGNPYTSHVNGVTFLTNEAAVSETQTLWVWNQATGASGAYEVKTIADAMVIAPAQGFFIKADAAGGTFNFAESNQAGSGGTFQRTEARPEMHLTLSNQSDVREAKIYYIENMTLGFDVGYEGELFNGVANPLAIYTHLVADSEGKNYQVQSLPENDFENTIIPLGINAISGSSISIEASKNNFPEGMNIYLEDKKDNSFTLLESDANFNTTLENDLSGIGRFYLHTTSSTMSTNDLATNNNLSIYSYNRETLRVVGIQKGVANISVYNLVGQEVLSSSFQGNGVNDISLPSIINGIYIVKITSENKITNKKIIIQ
jgi:hypothetical protein